MPSSGGNKPGPTEDNPAHLSHVPDWKKRLRDADPQSDPGQGPDDARRSRRPPNWTPGKDRTDYDRAIDAVLTAEREGLIILPEPEMKDRDQQISDLAEFFQVALGTNEE